MKKLLVIILFFVCISNSYAKEYSGFNEEYFGDIYYSRLKDNVIRYQRATKLTNNNNTNVYCLDPWKYIGLNEIYNIFDSDYASTLNIDKSLWNKISLISYYGYGYQNHLDEKWIAITQMLIWQTIDSNVQSYFTDGLNGNRTDIYIEEMKEINNLVSNHYIKPSFKNISLNLNDTYTLTDENNVLNLYDVETNLNVKKDNNKLIIIADKVGDYEINFIKKDKIYSSKPIIYVNNEYQNLLEVGSYDPVTIKISVKVTGGKIKINKFDNITMSSEPTGGGSLIGSKYGIYKNGSYVDTIEIGKKDESKLLPYGTYTVRELSAGEGYELDKKTYTVELKQPLTELTVYENIKKYNLTINKYYYIDDNLSRTEEGIIFELYSNGKLINTYTTDQNGSFTTNLPYGNYILKQINNFIPYKKNNDMEIFMNNDITYNLYNYAYKGIIHLVKLDSETGTIIPVAGGNLTGAKYKIYDGNNNYVDEIITKDGIADSKELLYGKYYVKEDSSSLGYELDNTMYEVNVENKKNNLIVYEKPLFYNLKISKGYTINNENKVYPEENITFEIYKNSSLYKIINTDSNGIINIDLPYGEYKIHQVNNHNNYKIDDDFNVFMNKDIIKEINNNIIMSKIKINLLDGENYKEIKENVIFEIRDKQTGEVFNYESINGFVFSDYFKEGNYEIVLKTKDIFGYVYSNYSKIIEINENSSLKYDDNGYYMEVNFYLDIVKGEISILKIGEKTIDNLNYNEVFLDNIFFELRNDKNELVSLLMTIDGKINVKNLSLGNYCLIEINVNDEYEQTSPLCFKLEFTNSLTPIVHKEIIINNYLKKHNLIIQNIDKDTNEKIIDSEFKIYNDDNFIKKIKINEDGLFELKNLKEGKYYMVQTNIDNYILNEEIINIELFEDKFVIIENQKIKENNLNGNTSEIISDDKTKEDNLIDNESEIILDDKISIDKEELGIGNAENLDEIILNIDVPDTYKPNIFIIIILIMIYVKKIF